MGELIEAMEAALIAFSAGRVVQPVRTILEIGERNFFGVMPALDAEASLMGAKLVTVLPGNTAKGLPSHQASIVLFDAASGALLGGGRRALHHRSAYRRGVGGLGAAHGAGGRGRARDHRLRRAGAQSSGSAAAGARFPRDQGLEPERSSTGSNSRSAAMSKSPIRPSARSGTPMWWCWPPRRPRR